MCQSIFEEKPNTVKNCNIHHICRVVDTFMAQKDKVHIAPLMINILNDLITTCADNVKQDVNQI